MGTDVLCCFLGTEYILRDTVTGSEVRLDVLDSTGRKGRTLRLQISVYAILDGGGWDGSYEISCADCDTAEALARRFGGMVDDALADIRGYGAKS